MVGDDEPVALAEHDVALAVLQAPTGAEVVARLAAWSGHLGALR